MATKDVRPTLEKEFVIVRIDYDRSKGAKDIEKRYVDKEQGLPWFAFVTPDGTNIIHSSEAPKGNVGMPWQDYEVDHLEAMLKKAKNHLTDADIAMLITSIKAFRKATEAGGGG